jgi:hypothetical protein
MGAGELYRAGERVVLAVVCHLAPAFLPDRASRAFGLRALFAFGPAIVYLGMTHSAQVRRVIPHMSAIMNRAWHVAFGDIVTTNAPE